VGVKIALAITVIALAALSGRAEMPAASVRSTATTAGIFVVRPDPRECPSPLCGGYWVSLANRARTKCSDGLLRPRCYVAAAETEKGGETQLPAYGLAKGTLGSRQFGGLGELGVLTVSATWDHAGEDFATGDFFRVRDTGVRCIRAPCFSFRAAKLNERTQAIRVSSVDLASTLDIPPETRRRAQAALRSREGLLAAGRIVATADSGRLFRASEIYFKEPPPRA
jgi:hypothetical protein